MKDLYKHYAFHFVRILSNAGRNWVDVCDDTRQIVGLIWTIGVSIINSIAGIVGLIIGSIILPFPYIFSTAFRKTIKDRNVKREARLNENRT